MNLNFLCLLKIQMKSPKNGREKEKIFCRFDYQTILPKKGKNWWRFCSYKTEKIFPYVVLFLSFPNFFKNKIWRVKYRQNFSQLLFFIFPPRIFVFYSDKLRNQCLSFQSPSHFDFGGKGKRLL